MRNCDTYTDLIFGMIEGDLTAGEQAELDQHLTTCVSCRNILDEMTAIKSGLTSLEKMSVSENFEAGLAAKLKQHRSDHIVPLHAQHSTESKTKTVSLFSRFMAYAAGFAVIALGFVAIERTGVINDDGMDMSRMQGTIAMEADTGNVDSDNQLDSLKKLNIQKLDKENIYRVSDEN